MKTAQEQEISRATPGAGLITPTQARAWREILSKLPAEIANDPSAQFVNPALLPALQQYIAASGGAVTMASYRQAISLPLSDNTFYQFYGRVEALHSARPENPYHSSSHTLEEVPLRLDKIHKARVNLELKYSVNERLGMSSACAHDLLHAGVGYAQRLTPYLNISNEERAVVHAARIALEAGYHPLQAFEIQRQILPTSFFQKPTQLGLDTNPHATFPVIDGEAGATIPKAIVARTYTPDLALDDPSRLAVQFLSLADVLVTDFTFEQFIRTAGLLFLEARIGSGFYPPNAEAFSKAQSSFLTGHVKDRLEAVADFLKPEFVNNHRALIGEYSDRVIRAGQICAGNNTVQDAQAKDDAALLNATVKDYLTKPTRPLNKDLLEF